MLHFCDDCGSDRWTKEEVLAKLEDSDNWVERGILAIYRKQTEDEKCLEHTKWANSVGFSAFHAKLGTYYANWLLKGNHLSGNHLVKARKLIKHYAGQLATIANNGGQE